MRARTDALLRWYLQLPRRGSRLSPLLFGTFLVGLLAYFVAVIIQRDAPPFVAITGKSRTVVSTVVRHPETAASSLHAGNAQRAPSKASPTAPDTRVADNGGGPGTGSSEASGEPNGHSLAHRLERPRSGWRENPWQISEENRPNPAILHGSTECTVLSAANEPPRGHRQAPLEVRPAQRMGGNISDHVSHVGNADTGSRVTLQALQDIYIPKDNVDYRTGGTIVYSRQGSYPAVRRLHPSERMRILVTGGAGFVGSHLVDRLMLMGHEVIVVDNFFTGSKQNVQHWLGHPNFELIRHDVVDPFMIEVDQIYHLACPASPPHYQYNPIKTVKTNVMGTINMLGLAKRTKARFLLSSTSEVYGDPEEHPQRETYWGHVNPIGPRACYDEGKRVAETLTYSYMHQDDVDVRVARIFNTFGPRMNQEDGRVVSNFIMQALRGENLTIYGDGSQTRSFQYIHDLVDGLILLMARNYSEPVNLGNPEEFTIRDFARFVRDHINRSSAIRWMPATMDDPRKRRPDISRAKTFLGWQPRFSVAQGIQETVEYFRRHLKESKSPA